MRGSTRLRIGSTFLALGLAFAFFAAPRGLILCVAEGDHIALEAQIDQESCVCAEATQVASGTATCTDTPLVQAALSDSQLRGPSAAVEPVEGGVEIPAASQVAISFAPQAHREDSTLRVIRSVVLLV